jgi:hypothetical protein
MRNFRTWRWQSWAILAMAAAILFGQVGAGIERAQERKLVRARVELPDTSDFMKVSYVQLDRDEDGHLVVYTDAYAMEQFEGRFKVALRDRDTLRHVFTPKWSEWLPYAANPDGTRYLQPETFQWWANYPDFVEPPPRAWVMETCWQARYDDPVLGLVELEPVCVPSSIDGPQKTSINNEATP